MSNPGSPQRRLTATRHLDKRDCPNPCSCGTHRTYSLVDSNWNKFYGNLRSMSSPLCGPGTISKTYTASYSWQVSGSIDPSVVSRLLPSIQQ